MANELIISKTSWLARYYAFLYDYGPNPIELKRDAILWPASLNLCRFMNRLFFWTIRNFLWWCLIAVLISALASLALSAVATLIAGPYFFIKGWPEPGFWRFLLTCGGVGWGIVVTFAVVIAFSEFRDWLARRESEAEYRERQYATEGRGIFAAWLQAKKQKVCPRIRVVD